MNGYLTSRQIHFNQFQACHSLTGQVKKSVKYLIGFPPSRAKGALFDKV
jgi:hypothetical protein